jgi:hypothetical protein
LHAVQGELTFVARNETIGIVRFVPGTLVPWPRAPRNEKEAASQAVGYVLGLILAVIIISWLEIRDHYRHRRECAKRPIYSGYYCEQVAESWLRWLP